MEQQYIHAGKEEIILHPLTVHVHPIEYILEQDANLTVIMVKKDAQSCHADVRVRLIGRRSHANIFAVIMGDGVHEIKMHTLQQHEAPETSSNLLVKTVLKDKAKFSYDGAIRVEKDAQKTDAYQRNENLVLSPFAYAESKPALEILANDVRCTHGATVGTIDDEQLFYLASRGISPVSGIPLIVEGFFEQVIQKISDTSIQEEIRRTL